MGRPSRRQPRRPVRFKNFFSGSRGARYPIICQNELFATERALSGELETKRRLPRIVTGKADSTPGCAGVTLSPGDVIRDWSDPYLPVNQGAKIMAKTRKVSFKRKKGRCRFRSRSGFETKSGSEVSLFRSQDREEEGACKLSSQEQVTHHGVSSSPAGAFGSLLAMKRPGVGTPGYAAVRTCCTAL